MGHQENLCRVIHLPDYHKSNPYQTLLLANLSKLGVDAKYGKRKIYFSNIDLSIIYNLIKNKKFDILHLHWQHPFMIHDNFLLMVFRSLLFIFQLLLLKCIKVKIVWTVHNLKNHENKFVKTEIFFSRIIARFADRIIAHCNNSKNEIVNKFQIDEQKIHVIEHGNYISVYKDKYTRNQSREILDIPKTQFVFLFLGLIRPYKGIIELIESYKRINASSMTLVIAGRIEDKELAKILIDKASGSPDILLKLQYIDDDEIGIYMKSADVLVLPYRDIINSGSAILGMSFGKAIISPRLGCMPEVLHSFGGVLYDPESKSGLVEAMQAAIASKNKIAEMGKANLQLAKNWNWQKVAAHTANIYFN
jgi:beta-1,4-mannosyltransferase